VAAKRKKVATTTIQLSGG